MARQLLSAPFVAAILCLRMSTVAAFGESVVTTGKSAFCWTEAILALIAAFLLVSYLLPLVVVSFLGDQNLRSKYDAKWAVVTGASSGIGRAITERLAKQGINVVLVAKDDELLTTFHKTLTLSYKSLQFKAIGVNMGEDNFMEKVIAETADLPVSLVFSNAGYLIVSSFRRTALEDHLQNVNCNAIAGVRITHHFYSKMIEQKLRGGICFTSSAAGYFPSPFSTMYGAGKAFVSSFAASLAVEAAEYGIDVSSVHPSYTRSNFYQSTPKLSIFKFLNIFGAESDDVARACINSLGRLYWRDMGGYAILTRLIYKIVDYNVLVFGITKSNRLNPDYKAFSHLK